MNIWITVLYGNNFNIGKSPGLFPG